MFRGYSTINVTHILVKSKSLPLGLFRYFFFVSKVSTMVLFCLLYLSGFYRCSNSLFLPLQLLFSFSQVFLLQHSSSVSPGRLSQNVILTQLRRLITP